ncbi:tautomerase family protein [Clostridium estertheticum]|uniref:tautomerase family protein n=1 Tax=Clostridium estertheticum TaxID=238834 RepID=UPI001C0B9B0C|nr:tautomerase family protein [Clostridium estertheticum]MBU3199224.1 tautomerase family protein [Clostridium estertheticum]WAG67525.1 tautomerase family protein [Clostridium estertheticum]
MCKLVKELTTSAANIMNAPDKEFIVFIKENEKENIGIAGQLLTDREIYRIRCLT